MAKAAEYKNCSKFIWQKTLFQKTLFISCLLKILKQSIIPSYIFNFLAFSSSIGKISHNTSIILNNGRTKFNIICKAPPMTTPSALYPKWKLLLYNCKFVFKCLKFAIIKNYNLYYVKSMLLFAIYKH